MKTIIVHELIKELQKIPNQNMRVVLFNKDYGCILPIEEMRILTERNVVALSGAFLSDEECDDIPYEIKVVYE